MKYLIVSDIHGSLPALEQVLAFYREQQCGMLCILGDILNYGPRNGIPQGLDPKGIAERLNAMAGEIVAIRRKRFFLTHGHIYNEDRLPKGRFDCLFYGHTHRWKLERTEHTAVCNTGSITFPKDGNMPTFAIYCDGTVSVHRLDGSRLKELSL